MQKPRSKNRYRIKTGTGVTFKNLMSTGTGVRCWGYGDDQAS